MYQERIIDEIVKNNPERRILDLYNLTKEQYNKLDNALESNSFLEWVRLSGTTDIFLLDSLKKNKSIKGLEFIFTLNDETLVKLIELLKINSSIIDLTLCYNFSTSHLNNQFFEILTINKIQKINFSRSTFNQDDFINLIESLQNNSNLKWLNLSNIFIIGYMNEKIYELLSELLDKLQVIHLLGVSMNDNMCLHLSKKIITSKTLTRLYLSQNHLTNYAIINLAENLKFNSTLQSLYLSENDFDYIGFIQLIKMLKVNSTLQDLDVSNNKLSDIGINISNLNKNTSLQYLNLSKCELNKYDIVYISQMLKSNLNLKRLNLSDNEIDYIGCNYISQAMEFNIGLKELNLSSNYMSADALKKNNHLEILDLTNTDIIDNTRIVKVLKENTTIQIRM